MTKIFKNVRVLLCALALSALTHGEAEAQRVVAPTPSPTPKPTATPAATATPKAALTPTPTSTPAPYTNSYSRRLSLVTEQGSFKNEFNSLSEAFKAAAGNSYNQTLKKGSEIVVMNARCGDVAVDRATFSLYSLPDNIATLVKSYLAYRPAAPTMSDDLVQRQRALILEKRVRERALIDEVMKMLAISIFPRKAECDAVPVALALSTSGVSGLEVLRLEVDDAQSPLIGTKFNDGFLHDALMQNSRTSFNGMVTKQEFWGKYGYNRFPNMQDAGDAALLVPGTEVIIFNGTNLSLYRLSYDFKFAAKPDDAQFDILKTTPIRKGWKIVAVFYGNKFIRIDDPKVK